MHTSNVQVSLDLSLEVKHENTIDEEEMLAALSGLLTMYLGNLRDAVMQPEQNPESIAIKFRRLNVKGCRGNSSLSGAKLHQMSGSA